MKFLCEQCKAKYQIADDKIAGKTVRMTCRKCGHNIEVRAAVTETSVATKTQEGEKDAAGQAGPRTVPLATSLAGARPNAPRPPGAAAARGGERAGALAGAFQKSVSAQPPGKGPREEEPSAPFDLAEIGASDEWYVAINGVPVGPVRIAEVRRKAAMGAVTEDSLCWQEGMEEWRPVRAIPEVAAIVREAAALGRTSMLTPAPETRISAPPPPPAPPRASVPPRPPPARPSAPSPGPLPSPGLAAAARGPSLAPAAPTARSNVVPITSRLATAERLDDSPTEVGANPLIAEPVPDPFRSPSTLPLSGSRPSAAAAGPRDSAESPFAIPPVAPLGVEAAAVASMPPAAAVAAPAQPRKAPPWIAIAMIVLAAAFGITAAIAIFLRPNVNPTPVVIQMSGSPATGPAPTTPTQARPNPTDVGPADTAEPGPSASAAKTGPAPTTLASGVKPAATTSATPSASVATASGGLDLSSLRGTDRVKVSDDPTGSKAANGQCMTQEQMQAVIGNNQHNVRRLCWLNATSTKSSVNIGVSLTVGPGGEVQSASCSGDDPAIARCVENEVRKWRFPALGCSQKTGFSFKFVRQ